MHTRVPGQKGISQACYIVKLYHIGLEPLHRSLKDFLNMDRPEDHSIYHQKGKRRGEGGAGCKSEAEAQR